MKQYTAPVVEFIELDTEVITASGCPDYVCPGSYGNSCTGRPYHGS